MSEVDFGGSGSTPYFGDGGRREATKEAREAKGDRVSGAIVDPTEGNVVPTGEVRNTGVDGGPGTRETDDFGREKVAPQVAGDFDAEPAAPSASPTQRPLTGPETHSVVEGVGPVPDGGEYDGETQGAKEPEPTGSVTANAAETGQQTTNPFEQVPSGSEDVDPGEPARPDKPEEDTEGE